MSLTSSQFDILHKAESIFGCSGGFVGLDISDGHIPKAVLSGQPSETHNIHLFHSLWQKIDKRQNEESQSIIKDTFKNVEEFGELCRKLQGDIDGLSEDMLCLERLKVEVLRKTEKLHMKCENLMIEKDIAETTIGQIKSRLWFVEEFPIIKQRLGQISTLSFTLKADDLESILEAIDAAILHFATNHTFVQADSNRDMYEDLRMQACTLIRTTVSQALEKCERYVDNQIKMGSISSGSLEPSLHYVRFRTAAFTLKPLTELLHKRVVADVSDVYTNALDQLEGIYTSTRIRLLGLPFRGNLNAIFTQHQDSLALSTRQSATYVLSVGQLEFNSFAAFFHARQQKDALRVLLTFLGDIFYDFTRSAVLSCDSVADLKEAATSLSLDVLEQPGGTKKMTDLSPLMSTFFRLHGDILERLIFKTETYIRDQIRGFTPAIEDLDYPNILLNHDDNDADPLQHPTKGWYPTLSRTLSCLWMIYRILEAPTFQGIAQEAVKVCLHTLINAFNRIRQLKGASIEAELFLIKHLLILREQVATFEVDLIRQERIFNFSGVKARLWDLVTKRDLVGLNSASGVFKYFSPVIQDSRTDTQQDLELALKHACEAFVARCSASVIMPLLKISAKFAQRVSQNKSNYPSQENTDNSTDGNTAETVNAANVEVIDDLKNEPYLSMDCLRSAFREFWRNLCLNIPTYLNFLRLYLSGEANPYPCIPKELVDEFFDDSEKQNIATTSNYATCDSDDASRSGLNIGLYDPNDPVRILIRPIQMSIVEATKQIDRMLKYDIKFSEDQIKEMCWKDPSEVERFFKAVLN